MIQLDMLSPRFRDDAGILFHKLCSRSNAIRVKVRLISEQLILLVIIVANNNTFLFLLCCELARRWFLKQFCFGIISTVCGFLERLRVDWNRGGRTFVLLLRK